jgi:hypothetical protein
MDFGWGGIMRRGSAILFGALLGTLVFARTGAAANAVVGTGTPASCSDAALNAAVAVVNPPAGGTITFNCGGAATINLASQKSLGNTNPPGTYTIDGGGLITLNGQNLTRAIFHWGGTLNVRNLAIRNGRASGTDDNGSGGAIRSDNATGNLLLNVTGVTFLNNVTNVTGTTSPFSPFDFGGAALYSRSGRLNVSGCTFTGNVANNSSGGAIHVRSSTLVVTGSTFTANASNGGGLGGAIYADGISPAELGGANGTIQISTTTFTDNTAYNIGGAFFFSLHAGKNEAVSIDTVNVTNNRVVDNSGTISWLGTRGIGGGGAVDRGRVTVVNTTFANNVAHSSTGGAPGGGLYLTNSDSVQITNSTFSGNRAEGLDAASSGGGLLILGNVARFQVTNSTVAFNYAGWTGGGIQSDTNGGGGVLTDTIVAHNTADNGGNGWNIQIQCSLQFTNGGGVLQYPNVVGTPGPSNPPCAAGQIVANPLLSPLAANGGFAPTHALGSGSPAIDTGTCVVATDQRGVTRPQGAGCDIGAYESKVGDIFYLRNSNTPGFPDITVAYGAAGDVPVVGDWNGDNSDTIGIFRQGAFYLRNANTPGSPNIALFYGSPGDIPVVGDWNGDGIDTIGIFRPSHGTFYLRNQNTPGSPDLAVAYGSPGDIPVVGDWNNDGIDTIGIFRPSHGTFYLRNTNTGGFPDITVAYGSPTDIPVVGDWNGDGTDTIGIYRPSHGAFYLRNTNTGGAPNISLSYGSPGDIPKTGDWNADGLDTIGVFRPS